MQQSKIKILEERLQFIIGFTQLTLISENHILWIVSQIWSSFQKIGILKLAEQMQQLHHDTVIINTTYTNDLELLFKLANPSVYLTTYLSYQYLFYSQCVILLILMAPMIFITASMSEEIELFKQSKFKSKNQLVLSQTENISDGIQIMHQIYNHHNYIENFQHKLMQDRSINSMKMVRLNLVAVYINYFPHLFLLPLLYFIVETDIIVKQLDDYLFYSLMTLLNIAIAFEVVIISFLSLFWVQSTFTLHDSNYLRLQKSHLEWLHQILVIMPIIITFATISSGLMVEYQNTITILNQVCLLSAFFVELYDDYINIPFITEFKYQIAHMMRSITLCLLLFSLTQFTDQQTINQTFIISPILAKLLIHWKEKSLDSIQTETLKREKLFVHNEYKKRRSQLSSSAYMESENNGLRIESENVKYKEFQSTMLKQYDLKYFIHFLSVIQQMDINEVGVYTRNSGVKMSIKRSRLLMSCIVLLKTHTENCTNQYCYCRGLKGEKRKIIEKYEIVKEMRMYEDFKILNIQFYIELIMRYLRDYAKLVFQLEIRKQQPNIMQLIQILIFISNSDESYQAQLQLLELKHYLTNKSTLQQRQAMDLLFSYSKFQILHRMKENIQRSQIENTLKYEDFRLCELDRDNLLKKIFQNIILKRETLTIIQNSSLIYESLENLLLKTNEQTAKVEQELMEFKNFSLSKTSLYCYMFFCLENTNNYDKFIKLCNQINTRETKFFENPAFYYKTEDQSYRVGFILLNMAQSYGSTQKRGEIVLFSKHMPSFIGYTPQEFAQVKLLDQLCYPSLVKPHDEMIEIFTLTNRPSIMFRTPLLLFTQSKTPGIVIPMEIFIDINFNYRNNILPCYCFLKEVKRNVRQEGQGGYLLIDNLGIIESVTYAAMECLELSSHLYLYQKKMSTMLPVFENIMDNLESKLNRYLEANKQVDESFFPGQTITTRDKLIQTFSTCHDQVMMSIDIDKTIQQYQMDVEGILCFSRVNKLAYKVYQLHIRNPYKLGAACSEMSPLTRSLSEYSNNSNQVIKLKDYVFIDSNSVLMDDRLPIINDPMTLRSQFNQFDLEEQPLQDLHQQDYLCSDAHDIQSKLDSSQEKEQSAEQPQRIYINSLSSASSRQSEIQKILTKAHFYRLFADLHTKPKLLYAILILNICSFIILLTFSITNSMLYNSWQKTTKSNIQILQAFSMTSYSRITTQGTMQYIQLLQSSDDEQMMGNLYEQNATQADMLQIVMDYNINQFSTLMDQQTENTIIRSVFSSIEFTQIDIFYKTESQVQGWTSLFQLMYMINSLHADDYSENKQQFLFSLFYLLKSYQKYNIAYEKLNDRFTAEINSILNSQDYTIDFLAYSFIMVFIIYFIISYFLQHSFYQLIKKYIRCCEQISNQSLDSEIKHLTWILDNYKSLEHFDLYEYHFSLKEKFANEDEEMANPKMQTLQSPNANNAKKFVQIGNRFNWKRQFTFLFHNVTLTITILLILFSRTYDKTLINDLQFNLNIYQKCISFTEAISEATLTNFAMLNAPLLVAKDILNESDQELFYQYTSKSYNQAVLIFSEILYNDNPVSAQLQTLFSSNICLRSFNVSMCESLNNGELMQGLMIPQNDIFQIIRDNIALYSMNKVPTELLQQSHLLSQNFMIDSILLFVDDVRKSIEESITASNQQKIIVWSLFYILIVFLSIFQISMMSKHIISRVRGIRRFVYLLPPRALYVEESFIKTLTYLMKIENQVFYL